MGIRAEARVIGEVPPNVVRVVVNHDRVAVPEPAVDEAIIERRHAEEEAAKPEAIPVSSLQVVDVVVSDAARKTSVLERVIEVIVGIAGAGIVSDPPAIAVDVRSIRMSLMVDKSSRSAGIPPVRRRRTMRWNVTATNATASAARVTAAATLTAAAALPGTSGADRESRKRAHRCDDQRTGAPHARRVPWSVGQAPEAEPRPGRGPRGA